VTPIFAIAIAAARAPGQLFNSNPADAGVTASRRRVRLGEVAARPRIGRLLSASAPCAGANESFGLIAAVFLANTKASKGCTVRRQPAPAAPPLRRPPMHRYRRMGPLPVRALPTARARLLPKAGVADRHWCGTHGRLPLGRRRYPIALIHRFG